jgi:hypothetical protein
MPTNIKTDQGLLNRLRASGRHVSKDQLRHQRVSFIFGALPADSNITRQQIETTLARSEGELT